MDETAVQISPPAQVESVIRRLSLLQAEGDGTADPFVAPLFPGFHFDTRLVAGVTPIERGGPLDFRISRPEGMRGWIINLTVKGVGEVFDGERRVSLEAGDLALFPPGAIHDYGRAPGAADWWHRWIYFQPRAFWSGWLSWRGARGAFFVQRVDDKSLVATLEALFDAEVARAG